MENRRAIHNNRHKVKNKGRRFKVNAEDRDKRLKRQQRLGRRRGIVGALEPATGSVDNAEVKVLTPVCVVCAYPFSYPSVICPNCGNCQACGKYSEDRYSNHCRQCGNHFEGPRLDRDVPQITADN